MPAELQTAPVAPAVRSNFARAFDEAMVVGRYEFRYFLASVRTLVSMAIYAGFACIFAYGYISNAANARAMAVDQFGDKALEVLDANAQKLLGLFLWFWNWARSADSAQADAAEIFRDHVPLFVVYFFTAAGVFLPLLVALVSFDQFSELSTRGARFALLRVRRTSYMIGKAVASIGAVAAFLLVMWAVVAGVAIWRDGASTASLVAVESARGWLLMLVLALPYLSITAFVSSLSTPVFAFLFTLATWIGIYIGSKVLDTFIPWLLEAKYPNFVDYERALLAIFPWNHAPNLISRDFATMMQGVLALLVIATAGYAATFAVIRSRDV